MTELAGTVAVVGFPNVGKSTLVNRLVGSKVSIVSDHPQTTRRRISGVVTGLDYQLVLLDLPGFQKPFDTLTVRMQATVDAALDEVDAAVLVLNAAEEIGGGDRFIAEAVLGSGIGFVNTSWSWRRELTAQKASVENCDRSALASSPRKPLASESAPALAPPCASANVPEKRLAAPPPS